jgi:hypothetical protein
MLAHDNNPSFNGNPSPPLVSESLKESKKTKKKRKNKNKPNKWADKCMYAELLEMVADDPWSSSADTPNDGLPSDLESGWVAVGPVPIGKRCLAVTHQSSGIMGNGMSLQVIFCSPIDSHFLSAEHHLTIPTVRKSSHSTVSICASSTHNP